MIGSTTTPVWSCKNLTHDSMRRPNASASTGRKDCEGKWRVNADLVEDQSNIRMLEGQDPSCFSRNCPDIPFRRYELCGPGSTPPPKRTTGV